MPPSTPAHRVAHALVLPLRLPSLPRSQYLTELAGKSATGDPNVVEGWHVRQLRNYFNTISHVYRAPHTRAVRRTLVPHSLTRSLAHSLTCSLAHAYWILLGACEPML